MFHKFASHLAPYPDVMKENENLRAELKHLKEVQHKMQMDARSATMIFDFDAMKPFSLERHPGLGSNPYPLTIIAFCAEDDEGNQRIKEWTYYCDETQHERLATEFADYLLRR